MKPFNWPRSHKFDEWVEQQMIESVYEYILEFYNIKDINELTQEQIDDIEKWRYEDLSEYSPLQWGFSFLVAEWDMNNAS